MSTNSALGLLGATAMLALSSTCCRGVPAGAGEGLLQWPWRTVRGSGSVVEVTREVSGFTGVSLRGVGHLTIEQGETEGLRIEAEDNVTPYLETQVEGTTLVIATRSGVRLRPTRPIVFRVTLQELATLEISGSGEAEADGIEADDLSITVSGSGNASLPNLESDSLRVSISGSGNVETSGRVQEQKLTISGSGEYRARDLESVQATVRVSGSGSATLRVSDSLDATVSGSGSVRYVGIPAVESRVTGSGSVREVGD